MMKYLCFAVIACAVLTGCERKLDSFQQLVKELDEAEQDIRSRQDEIRDMIQEYNESHPDEEKIDGASAERLVLNPNEVETLNRMLGNEQDVSYKGLLSEVVKTHERISGMQERIRQLQDELPAPYTVRPGDTHRDVALKYLMDNHGLTIQKARELVDETALVEELFVGFQIWLLYRDGIFGSYVTQGSAPVSPGRAQRQAKQRVARTILTLTDERDVARIEADSLQNIHDSLQERIVFLRNEEGRLQNQIASLTTARDEAMARVKLSEQQKKELEARLGSIHYEVATMNQWKKDKVIADPIFGGPRVKSLANVQFSKTQDIRNNNILTFDLRDFPELKQIKRIDVFPRSFKLGQEYDISFDSDGLKAHVMILNLDVFVGQKIIFALRD